MLSVAEATQTTVAVATQNRSLSTDLKRMATFKVRDATLRGARKYCEEQGFVTVHNMPCLVGVTGACENTNPLFTMDWYEGKKMTKRPFSPGASVFGLYRKLCEFASH